MKQWTPEEIRDFRQRLGLYQKGLAALLRVSTNYVYLIEKGVRSPSNTMRALLDCIEREYEKGKGVKRRGSKGNL
jgi:DNA-binding transcriptional regulator YiaG